MNLPRRSLLKGLLTVPIAGCLWTSSSSDEQRSPAPIEEAQLQRIIPKSGEPIPAVGLGTYQAFASLGDRKQQQRLIKVLTLFAQSGGRVIDTSPMYSQAETVLGKLLPQAAKPSEDWFLATKVWTDGAAAGRTQIDDSQKKLGVSELTLNQIHNLRDWKVHLDTLKQEKAAGRLQYIGTTTWGGLRHSELEQVMKTGDLDFIQVTYNIQKREVEKRVLPLAKDLGIGVIVNRPFGQGSLFSRVKGKALPHWVKTEIGCQSWAQLFLKFVLADPRVTAVIPATSKPKHLVDNMGAGTGPLPDQETRSKLISLLQ